MARMTLLEIVQEVLNDIDSDFVNSINDTEEAEQVSSIVESTYRGMMSSKNWPHTARITNLTPSGDVDFPVYMTLPEDTKELISLNYDKQKSGATRTDYREVHWKAQDDFLRYINSRNSGATNVTTITDPSGVKLQIINDKAPEYFTSFDDETLIFDSYDSAVDSTLQASKTQARLYTIPTFTQSDTFVPDLPVEAFTALVEEAKARAASKLASKIDPYANKEASKQNKWLSRRDWAVHPSDMYPANYGRGKHKVSQEPTFRRK